MQKLHLSIPDPCHENWHHMTPTDQGRFCNACAKEVVDFSMMTDAELLHYLANVSNEKVCGRALPSQLERTINYPKEPKKRLFWYWNYIMMFFMFFSKTNSSKAQGNVSMVKVADLNGSKPKNINEALEGKVGGLVVRTRLATHIKITDENGQPVPFATIRMADSKNGISADAAGSCTMGIDRINTVLEVSAVGYEMNRWVVKDFTEQIIVLQKNRQMLGEVVVVAYPVTLKGAMRISCTKTYKSVKKNIIKDSVNAVKTLITDPFATINVYPNPVRRGSSFALALQLKQAGEYHIGIFDALGRVILQKQIHIMGKEYMEQVQTDGRWGSGVYYINVSDKNNKPIGKRSFIVK